MRFISIAMKRDTQSFLNFGVGLSSVKVSPQLGADRIRHATSLAPLLVYLLSAGRILHFRGFSLIDVDTYVCVTTLSCRREREWYLCVAAEIQLAFLILNVVYNREAGCVARAASTRANTSGAGSGGICRTASRLHRREGGDLVSEYVQTAVV